RSLVSSTCPLEGQPLLDRPPEAQRTEPFGDAVALGAERGDLFVEPPELMLVELDDVVADALVIFGGVQAGGHGADLFDGEAVVDELLDAEHPADGRLVEDAVAVLAATGAEQPVVIVVADRAHAHARASR